MTTDIQSLSGPALSAAVATEVMGWHDRFAPHMWGMTSGDELKGLFPKSEWVPDCDTRDARKVVVEIQRRGLINRLHGKLMDSWRINHHEWTWTEYLLTCPPSDICRAALRVVREAGKDQCDRC